MLQPLDDAEQKEANFEANLVAMAYLTEVLGTGVLPALEAAADAAQIHRLLDYFGVVWVQDSVHRRREDGGIHTQVLHHLIDNVQALGIPVPSAIGGLPV